MNKSELIGAIAADADVSKAVAARMLDSFVERTKKSLRRGGSVSITNFGTFELAKRAARTGRNPGTGDPIKIKAKRVAKFRPSKNLNETL